MLVLQLYYTISGVLTRSEGGREQDSVFAYTGYEYEESTGLYYAKARYYQAEDGRFLSEDAYRANTSEEGNWNRYIYVKNNPIRYWDPSGNVVETITMGGLAALKILLTVFKITVIIAVVMIAGEYIRKEIRVEDLATKKVLETLKKAKQVVVGSVTYTAKKFVNILMWAKECIQSWGGTNESREKIGEKTPAITIPTTLPADYKVASVRILELKKGQYYSAFLDEITNKVYIGPRISEGMAIIIADNMQFGIFTFSGNQARALVSKLGIPISHPAHKGVDGYFKHYHLKRSNGEPANTHIWYFG